ncbi:MAG: hypothetical protein ACREA9_11765 [Pyrinomonadaceae bacterium]
MSRLGREDDGAFSIFDVGGLLKGLHVRYVTGLGYVQSELMKVSCDGIKMSFTRTDPATGQEIEYIDGEIIAGDGFFRIKGKFKKGPGPIAADDWTAEKPT